jgi:hypothetical protein
MLTRLNGLVVIVGFSCLDDLIGLVNLVKLDIAGHNGLIGHFSIVGQVGCFVGLIDLGNFGLVSHLGVGLIGYIGIGLNGISLVGIGFFGVNGLISFVGIGFFCINGLISVGFVGLVSFISSSASTLLLLASLASSASLALSFSLVLLVFFALASMASWHQHYCLELWHHSHLIQNRNETITALLVCEGEGCGMCGFLFSYFTTARLILWRCNTRRKTIISQQTFANDQILCHKGV